MVKHLLAVAALITPSIAAAQTFPKPPDVPAYVAVTPTYTAGTAPNVSIDATVTPPTSIELADIPSAEPAAITAGSYAGTSAFCTLIVDGGTCSEPKFRTEANATHLLFDDPIRNYGQPGTSHCHTFFGNPRINAYSTFATVRAAPRTLARGNTLNKTGYWFPCVQLTDPFGDGKNYAHKPDLVIIYYQEGVENHARTTHLRLGLRYVTGVDMDDPNRTWLQAHLDAANAQSGTAGRYTQSSPGPTGRKAATPRWACNSVQSDWLKNADGSDPWAGACTAGSELLAQLDGSRCWDGKNLWSPGGYKHIIPEVWDNVDSEWTCPNNYYRVPGLIVLVRFSHNGFDDYSRWRLASDDHMQAKLTELGTPRTVLNGESFHTDWFNGWDRVSLHKWLDNCIGIENGTAKECGTSTISATERLATGNFNGALTPDTSVAAEMFRIPTTQAGPATIHVHGN